MPRFDSMVRLVLILLPLAAGAGLQAQKPGKTPIEIKILEVLHGNGVITDEQKDDLVRYADELRREEAAEAGEADLSRQVEDLLERVEKDGILSDHKAGRGFRWRTSDKDFALEISGRLKVRATRTFWRVEPDTRDDNETDFTIEQARLIFGGHAFSKDFRYEVMIDVAGDMADTEVSFLNIVDEFESDNRLAELKNAFIEYAPGKAFRLRAGQFRVPYSRQSLTGASNLQFVERSIVSDFFAPGRDIGVMAHGGFLGEDEDGVTYAAGLFNGEGENRENDDEGLFWVGRVATNPLGDLGGTESHMSAKDEFRVSLGLNAWFHQDDGHLDDGDAFAVGADLGAKWLGFSFLAEVHRMRMDTDGRKNPSATGWFAQLGYMLVPETLEVAVRTSHIDWDHTGGSDTAAREHLVVVNWFLEGHDLKLQTDFGWIEKHEGDHSDNREGWRARMQLQLSF